MLKKINIWQRLCLAFLLVPLIITVLALIEKSSEFTVRVIAGNDIHLSSLGVIHVIPVNTYPDTVSYWVKEFPEEMQLKFNNGCVSSSVNGEKYQLHIDYIEFNKNIFNGKQNTRDFIYLSLENSRGTVVWRARASYGEGVISPILALYRYLMYKTVNENPASHLASDVCKYLPFSK